MRFAVIGYPVHHSLSPKMHTCWMQELNVLGQYDFCETDGSESNFRKKIFELHQKGYSGCNVTIPHKLHACRICDELSLQAKFVGAVNTLIFDQGKINGENTDIIGFLSNIEQSIAYRPARETAQATIIGAGGAARSVLYGLFQEGFNDVVIVNRTLDKAEELIADFQKIFPQCTLSAVPFERLNTCLEQRIEHSLVVNTTSIGMSGQGSWNINFTRPFFVTDVVYTPLMTPFLQSAAKAGLEYRDGFDMLMYQGAESFRLWTGQSPDVNHQLRQYLLT